MSDQYAAAVQYAAHLHRNQVRKGTSAPYLAHLLGVSALVLEFGGTETQAIAALLHDALEDQPRDGQTEQEIFTQFGPDVLAIVKDATNDFKGLGGDDGFANSKKLYLNHLEHLNPQSALVAFADKLHNARSIVTEMRGAGTDPLLGLTARQEAKASVLNKFKGKAHLTLWYYRCLAAIGIFAPRLNLPASLRHALRAEVEAMHQQAFGKYVGLDANEMLNELEECEAFALETEQSS